MSGTDSLPAPPTAAFVRVWFDIPSAGLTSSLISVTDTQTTLDLVEKVQAVCQRRDLGDLKGSPTDQRFLLCMPSKSHSLFLYPSSMLLWKAAKRAPVDTIRLGGSGAGAEGGKRDVLVCAGFLMDTSTIREHNPTFEDNAKTALSVKVPLEFKDVLAQMMELYNKDNSPNVIRRRRPDENVDASSTDFAASSLSFNEGSMMGSSSVRAPTAGAGEGVVVGSTATVTATTTAPKESNEGPITSKIDQQLATTKTATPQQPAVAVTATSPPTRQDTPVVVPPTRKAAVPLQESIDAAIVTPPPQPPVAAPTMAAYGVDDVIHISLRVQLSPNQPGAVNLSTTVHYYRGDFAQEVVHAALARFRSEASETSKAHGYDVEMLRAAIPTDPTTLMLAVSHTNNTTTGSISSMDDVSMFTADDPLPILSPPGGGASNARLVVAPASVRRARSADHHHPTTSQLSSSGGAPAYISPLKIHRVLKAIPSVRDDPSIDYENRSSRCADLEKHLNKLTAELDVEVAEISALEKEVTLATKERDGLAGSVEDAKAASRDCERLENLKSWLERDLEERVESERSTRNKLYLSDDGY